MSPFPVSLNITFSSLPALFFQKSIWLTQIHSAVAHILKLMCLKVRFRLPPVHSLTMLASAIDEFFALFIFQGPISCEPHYQPLTNIRSILSGFIMVSSKTAFVNYFCKIFCLKL
jgi:hypothetical protein